MIRKSVFVLLSMGASCAHPTASAPATPVPSPAPPSPIKPAAAASSGTSARTTEHAPPLPPIPLVEGPLAIHVVYPAETASPTNRDSSYMVGSVGNGHAMLTINGHHASVYPNGAFLAFIPQPPSSNPRFELVATLGADTARLTHTLRAPVDKLALPLEGKLIVDTSEFAQRAASGLFLRDDEKTTVSLRVPANASAMMVTGTQSIPLNRNGDMASRSVLAAELRAGGHIVVVRGRDTTRVPIAPLAGPRADAPEFVRLGKGMTSADTDAVIYGRTLPNDNYKWFLLPGTAVELTGRVGEYTRIRVADDLEMWVANVDVDTAVARPARRVTSNGRVRSTPMSADLVIPITSTPPFFVEEHERQIDLVLYGVLGNTDIINYPSNDSLVRSVTWEQESADRIRFTLHLTERPIGYMALWEHGNFVLRIRRIPNIDPANPLRGRTIALDPGHPPSGATGPTSLYEGQAVLWVGEIAKAMLEAKGATVVMTRTTMDTLGLPPRRTISRRADADAFVSIHLNSYPDGVNPFVASNGSGTYFYRTHSEPLGRAIQQRLIGEMGLRDEGVFFRSLAVTVQSWFPAVLTEGAFVIIPEQEAALRTREFQERYARALVTGLEAYFRGIAR